MNQKPVTTASLRKMKANGVPISVVTAYDYPSARLADEAGVDMILVGDSLGNVVLGYDSTLPVTLEDMIYHTRAVCRGTQRPFIVTDMPFMTYHGSLDQTLNSVARLMREGGCKAVKVEGGSEIADTVRAIVSAGVPVVGHLGLTPQSVHQIGGYRVQGKTQEQADKLLQDALALEEAGALAIVLELMPEQLARSISQQLSIPTIGIGAGAGCDGQVLVFHDLLGYASPVMPKRFVKMYADIGSSIREALAAYVAEVKSRAFPSSEHVFLHEHEAPAALYGSSRGEGEEKR